MQWNYILKTLKFTIISQFILNYHQYNILLERPRSPWQVHAGPFGLRGAQVGNLWTGELYKETVMTYVNIGHKPPKNITGQVKTRTEGLQNKSHAPPWANVSIIAPLSPRHTALPEKLSVPQLVKKLPALYGTQRFITVSTTAPPPVPTLSQFKKFKFHCNMNVSFTLRFSKWSLFLPICPPNPCMHRSSARTIHSSFSAPLIPRNPLYPHKI